MWIRHIFSLGARKNKKTVFAPFDLLCLCLILYILYQ
jgi:hypothetical protein